MNLSQPQISIREFRTFVSKANLIEFIEKIHFPEFKKYASILPGGQCGTCRAFVTNYMKDPNKGETAQKKG